MSRPRAWGRPLQRAAAAGIAIDAAVVLADALTPELDVPIAPLAIAPLLPAAAGLLGATAVVAGLSITVAIAMTAFHANFGLLDESIRLLTLIVVCVLAVLGARLQRRVEALVQALDALPDAVTIQSVAGQVTYGNHAAARLVGERDQASVPTTAAESYMERFTVTDEQGEPVVTEQLPGRRILRGLEAEPLVLRSTENATGLSRWTRVQASPLRDAEGRVHAAVNVIEDITDVKLQERGSAFLAEAGVLLASSLDTEETLQRVAQLVVPELADWCSIDLEVAGGRLELVALAHRDAEKVALGHELRRRYPPDLTRPDGPGGVLRTGEPVLYPEITEELLEQGAQDAEHLAVLKEIGFASALIVPLTVGTRIIGVLTWVATESRRSYGPADLQTAMDLARRAALAVENARVHSTRVEIASVLQAALLPEELPPVPGWELAADYRAAGEANEVGGDFYDAVPRPDGAVLALVGDVVGKGAPAAALTAQTRHTLVTATALGTGDPSAGLSLLNSALQSGETLALCSVAVLFARGAELTVISAGHPLPLLRRAGDLREVGTTSPLLGAAPIDQVWTQTTVELEPGDLLLLYTDGVTDAVGATERFGEERLREAVLAGDTSPQATIDRVTERLEAFEHGLQADDRALLALRYAG